MYYVCRGEAVAAVALGFSMLCNTCGCDLENFASVYLSTSVAKRRAKESSHFLTSSLNNLGLIDGIWYKIVSDFLECFVLGNKRHLGTV